MILFYYNISDIAVIKIVKWEVHFPFLPFYTYDKRKVLDMYISAKFCIIITEI